MNAVSSSGGVENMFDGRGRLFSLACPQFFGVALACTASAVFPAGGGREVEVLNAPRHTFGD